MLRYKEISPYSKLYSHPKSDAITHGTLTEPEAKMFFEAKNDVQVKSCGLFIDDQIKFLGATPDG